MGRRGEGGREGELEAKKGRGWDGDRGREEDERVGEIGGGESGGN
jgi:hypothetical protein